MGKAEDMKVVEELLDGIDIAKAPWAQGWLDTCPYCGCEDFVVDATGETPDVAMINCPKCHFGGCVHAPWELQDEKYDDHEIVIDLSDIEDEDDEGFEFIDMSEWEE
jgi:hypothetical protein